MTTAPFFPLYLKDWVMDTRGYTHEDKGVFVDLLVLAWDRGGLPTDTEAVRKLALCSAAVWRRVWPTLAVAWIERDGVLVHIKLEAARENVEKRSATAKAKADKRWSADAESHAPVLPQQCHGNADTPVRSNAITDNRLQILDNRPQTTETKVKTVSSEALTRSEPATDAVLEFPTVGPQRSWGLSGAQVAAWAELFPTSDVRAECQQALAWVQANPSRRKTARGMPSFLVSWLGRSVDRGRAGPTMALTKSEHRSAKNAASLAAVIASLEAEERAHEPLGDGGDGRRESALGAGSDAGGILQRRA